MLIDSSDVVTENDNHLRRSEWALDNIKLANSAIDVLRSAAYLPLGELDYITLFRLGIRLINSAGAAGNDALHGFYQPAAAHIRDIIEVGFLLDLFRRDGSQITAWRNATEKERWKVFRPKILRQRLDHLDGRGASYRADAYKFFSDHGTHVNPNAALISPEMNTKVGPFPDERLIVGISFDLARHLAAATLYFTRNISGHQLDQSEQNSEAYLIKAISFLDAINAFKNRTSKPDVVGDSN